MHFKKHLELEGRHAFLGASKSSWLRYTPERLAEAYGNRQAAMLGTRKHNLAKELIELGQELPNTSQTLNLYVNHCIGYRMSPEVVLKYSEFSFGTCDAIDFSNGVLRIFDLKTGVKETSEDQLYLYAGFFCWEYDVRPMEIDYDLRIYQNDDIHYIDVDPYYVVQVMSIIKESSDYLMKLEGGNIRIQL